MFGTPSLVPHTTAKSTGKKNHDPKTSATLHESAPAPKETSATLHGSVPVPKKTSATLHWSAPATQGRPRSAKRQKCRLFIKNVDFSLEKCVKGTRKGVLHYVLRRERVTFRKKGHFELEICVKARGGRAARCMGSVPVAEMLASEARHPRTRVARQLRRQRTL